MSTASPTRRVFLMHATAGTLLAASTGLHAQTRVDEADDNAVALGYRQDTAKVDAKKYATHKPDQKCSNCQFWQGTPADAYAGCAMFGRKQIAAGGWCMAYKKVA